MYYMRMVNCEDPDFLFDASVIDQVRSMDQNVLVAVFDRYAPFVFHYGCEIFQNQIKADSLVGSVFQRMLEELAQGKGPEDNISLYLLKTAQTLAGIGTSAASEMKQIS